MPRQTVVQNSNAIRFGSGLFEVDDGLGGWIDLGAMRGIQFEESWDEIRVMSDNAGPVTVGIRNHRAALVGNLMEIELSNLAKLRGGLDDYSTEDGSQVTGEDQAILQGSWGFETFVELSGQMHDGTAPNVTAVVGSENGALAAGNDYNIVKNAAGKWGIVLHEDGITLDTESQNITVTSTYTPAAKKVFESGGRTTITPVAVRVTNTNEAGKIFRITIYKASSEEGIAIELPGDEDEDPAMVPIRMAGDMDTTKDVGKRLFKIEDEQSV